MKQLNTNQLINLFGGHYSMYVPYEEDAFHGVKDFFRGVWHGLSSMWG